MVVRVENLLIIQPSILGEHIILYSWYCASNFQPSSGQSIVQKQMNAQQPVGSYGPTRI